MRRVGILGFATGLIVAAAACTGIAPAVTGTPTAVGAVPRSAAPRTAPPSPSPSGPPRFDATIEAIDPAMRAEMIGKSWHPGCPVPIRDLRLLTMNYWGFDGAEHHGQMIVNATVAGLTLGVFHKIFDARFPIKDMELADVYLANDNRLLMSDVTSAFNCRPVIGTTDVWSQHAYGLAVDINPLQNPYVRSDGTVLRKPAQRYTDRSLHAPGMIHPGDVVTRAFAEIGWGWGGNWTSIKDYQHFSANGR